MNKTTLNTAYAEINNFKDKLGEVFWDAMTEDDNTTYDMAKGIVAVFANCSSKKEFEAADDMLAAVCGYNMESLIQIIKERDAEEGHIWQSCEK